MNEINRQLNHQICKLGQLKILYMQKTQKFM